MEFIPEFIFVGQRNGFTVDVKEDSSRENFWIFGISPVGCVRNNTCISREIAWWSRDLRAVEFDRVKGRLLGERVIERA